MLKSKFLYLPIEVKPRELDSKILIALEACKKDYSVFIGTKSVDTLLKSGPRGIYFYKDTSAPLLSYFKRISNIGHKVVVHDEEGLVHQSDQDYLKRRILFKTLKFVDLFFCWGIHQENLLNFAKNKIGADLEVVVTGHPRFDLLRDPIRTYNSPKNKDRENKTILINTKLAECNHRRGANGWLDLLKSHGMLHSDNCLSLRREQIEYKKVLFSHYVELIKSLSSKFPNADIVIRPHPSENFDTWIDLFEEFTNVNVTTKGNIGYWLARSDLVIHTGCTTAIESFASGTPVISFKPIYDERFEIALPNDVSIVSNSQSECEFLVERLLENDSTYFEKDEFYINIIKKHVDNIEGQFSYERIVEQIERLDISKSRLYLFQIYYWRISAFFRKVLRNLKFNKNKFSSRDISESELKKAFCDLSDASGLDMPIITKVKDNVFLVRKNNEI